MVLNYTEIDNRVQKILNVLTTLGFSFEVFSNKRIIIVDNNVTFAEKRNIGIITMSGDKVSLRIYGHKCRGRIKSKMKTNEIIFKANASLTDVGSKTRALVRKFRDAELCVCCENATPSLSTAYFVNESSITGLGYLNEYMLTEDVQVREATNEEIKNVYTTVVEEEIQKFYPDLVNNPQQHQKMLKLWVEGALNMALPRKVHAYTTDGTDVILISKLADNSNYIAMAYVPPDKRGQAESVSVFKKIIDESPNGLSFHTNRDNRTVIGLAKHFGMKEYPSTSQNDLYFATKDGLVGATLMQQ